MHPHPRRKHVSTEEIEANEAGTVDKAEATTEVKGAARTTLEDPPSTETKAPNSKAKPAVPGIGEAAGDAVEA